MKTTTVLGFGKRIGQERLLKDKVQFSSLIVWSSTPTANTDHTEVIIGGTSSCGHNRRRRDPVLWGRCQQAAGLNTVEQNGHPSVVYSPQGKIKETEKDYVNLLPTAGCKLYISFSCKCFRQVSFVSIHDLSLREFYSISPFGIHLKVNSLTLKSHAISLTANCKPL